MKNNSNDKMKSNNIVSGVISYILERPAEELRELTIKDLTVQFRVSRSFLTKRFRRELGLTPGKYIQLAKMIQAAFLLAGCPGLTVKELTELSGFSSCDYFTQLFKAHYGTTPGKFRRARLKAKMPPAGLRRPLCGERQGVYKTRP
ncbi:MAG: helix-turn-helix transcriptional regulator [bacterium]|nr:helix-turn-helix transcriptional regulator [bacterium]